MTASRLQRFCRTFSTLLKIAERETYADSIGNGESQQIHRRRERHERGKKAERGKMEKRRSHDALLGAMNMKGIRAFAGD
jgi:hypothetical protein